MDRIEKLLEEYKNEPNLQNAILRALHLIMKGINLNVNIFGAASFGDCLTITTVMRGQERIDWLNFFSGR